MKKDCFSKCPKCGKSLASSSKKSKNKDANILGLALLFGDVSFRKNKKGSCDLCGGVR